MRSNFFIEIEKSKQQHYQVLRSLLIGIQDDSIENIPFEETENSVFMSEDKPIHVKSKNLLTILGDYIL